MTTRVTAARPGLGRAGKELTMVVHYPSGPGRLALRAEPDWEKDIAPSRSDPARGRYEFRLPAEGPFLYFKPVVHDERGLHWALGENSLALASAAAPTVVYPYFFEEPGCTECAVAERRSRDAGDGAQQDAWRFRVFLPPGYHENTLARYPVAYMQDGQNLFFPEESFGGAHWRVRETLEALDSMSLIRKAIVVGVYPRDRMRDYTRPGYEAYGRFLVRELKPWIDATYRTLPGPEETAVLGSSLGGVVSFYLAWEHPQVFGMAGCLSSTFGWQDDLLARVASEPRRKVRFYLDSGWPRDNYEVTRAMRDRLAARGYRPGHDLFHLAYPEAKHDERAWAGRLHVPFQWFFQRPA
ncbi:MAG TPA: alpha/beta hydrolase-fold protein [Candidatus Polarisedimenticolia bacterium]|jgi:predicted alpha/beta superfamily hydrolase|nr:alpha/beta hydrolase-fold protein [Candidatus Polarisedimenticolia bacterium]